MHYHISETNHIVYVSRQFKNECPKNWHLPVSVSAYVGKKTQEYFMPLTNRKKLSSCRQFAKPVFHRNTSGVFRQRLCRLRCKRKGSRFPIKSRLDLIAPWTVFYWFQSLGRVLCIIFPRIWWTTQRSPLVAPSSQRRLRIPGGNRESRYRHSSSREPRYRRQGKFGIIFWRDCHEHVPLNQNIQNAAKKKIPGTVLKSRPPADMVEENVTFSG